jgi:hypothetical protein
METRLVRRLAVLLCVSIGFGCSSDGPANWCSAGEPALRVVNAFTTTVDVLIDGASRAAESASC